MNQVHMQQQIYKNELDYMGQLACDYDCLKSKHGILRYIGRISNTP